MSWIAFKDRMPPDEGNLITRSMSCDRKKSSFDTWSPWRKEYKKTVSLSHWWNGPNDLEIAIDAWKSRPKT